MVPINFPIYSHIIYQEIVPLRKKRIYDWIYYMILNDQLIIHESSIILRRDVTGMMVNARGIIPEWPQVSEIFSLVKYYNSARHMYVVYIFWSSNYEQTWHFFCKKTTYICLSLSLSLSLSLCIFGNSSVWFGNNSVCYFRNGSCLVSLNRSALFRNNPRRLHPQIHGWELRKKTLAGWAKKKKDVARIDGKLIGNHQFNKFNTMFFHFKPYLAYLPMLYGIPTISTHGSPLVFHPQKPGAGTSPVATLRPWSCGSKPCNRRPWRWLVGFVL